jgi:hypothetical protein
MGVFAEVDLIGVRAAVQISAWVVQVNFAAWRADSRDTNQPASWVKKGDQVTSFPSEVNV